MDPKKLERLTNGSAAASESVSESDADLNDAAVQEQILNPQPQAITIGGKETIVHQLSARVARRFAGFVSMLLTEAVGGKTDVDPKGLMMNRTLALLNLRYEDDFLPILAAATGKPGTVTDEAARLMAAQFSETITAVEVQRAFLTMYSQNTPVRTQSKKAPPAAATTKTPRTRRTH